MKKILVVLISTLLITGCGIKTQDNVKEQPKEEVKAITEKEVIKDQVVDGLNLTNTSLTLTNGVWKLVTQVTNNTGSDYNLDKFEIIIKDIQGQEIKRLTGYVGNTIANGSTKTINTSTDFDLSKAAKVEYEIKK